MYLLSLMLVHIIIRELISVSPYSGYNPDLSCASGNICLDILDLHRIGKL